MFYVSGGGTADIYKVDRSGAIVETLTDLRPFRLEDGGHALPKGLVLAPASNSEGRSLWVGDYGRDQVADGRLFEIRLEDSPVAVASASQTARSEEHTSELQSLMRTSYAVFFLKKKNKPNTTTR